MLNTISIIYFYVMFVHTQHTHIGVRFVYYIEANEQYAVFHATSQDATKFSRKKNPCNQNLACRS